MRSAPAQAGREVLVFAVFVCGAGFSFAAAICVRMTPAGYAAVIAVADPQIDL